MRGTRGEGRGAYGVWGVSFEGGGTSHVHGGCTEEGSFPALAKLRALLLALWRRLQRHSHARRQVVKLSFKCDATTCDHIGNLLSKKLDGVSKPPACAVSLAFGVPTWA